MDFIEVYPNALPAEYCAKACERMDAIINRPDPGDSCILSDNESRTDWNIFSKRYSSLLSSEDAIIEAVWNGWRLYNKKYGVTSRTFPEIFAQGWKLQRSSTGGGFHAWHSEQGSGENNMSRFGVWMIYLNTVETGGKTEFKFQDLQIKPEVGTLVIWPAAYTHVHRAAPDLVGDKYIATGWFNFPTKKDIT